MRVAPWPQVDFAAFGEIETTPLSRIQTLTGAYLARNWVSIPHVFHQDEADVVELEALRRRYASQHPQAKVTPLAFLVKAVAKALQAHPRFNASIDTANGLLILKKYVHIGVAVNTPAGLVVPVIRDCDKRSVAEIAVDIERLATKAREKGLPMADMMGGCFTVSSLGHQGGTSFTPIINAPEVAILGVARMRDTPRRAKDDGVEWRQTLPLSLSYDHRVLNGVDAGAFMTDLCRIIASPEPLVD